MKNLIYCFPFLYFYKTRLQKKSIIFHIVFEWMAAIVLVLTVSKFKLVESLVLTISSYVAFISLYEIGYIINDLFSSVKECNGRKRNIQVTNKKIIILWFCFRVVSFIFITFFIKKIYSPEWWFFFLSLCVVFSIHNQFVDPIFKSVTFLWLSWLRFMAPIFFVIDESQIFGIGTAVAMEYVTFRLLSYLESKELIYLPIRKKINFRVFFFLLPLIGWIVFWPYEQAKGFFILTGYYAASAMIGLLIYKIKHSIRLDI